MTRTANRQGSWRKRGGRWEYRLQVDGQDVSASGRTKTEALERMDAKVERIKNGKPRTDARITVKTQVEQWLDISLQARTTKRGRPLAESTKAMYRNLAVLYISGRRAEKPTEPEAEKPTERASDTPAIGRMRLDRLKMIHVEAMVTDMRARGLAESTIRTTYHVLRLALDHAVANGMLKENPARSVTRPGKSDEDAEPPRSLSLDELLRLIEAAKEYRYHECITLIAATGMRRGEALALRWEHVDLVEGTASINGTLARINGALTVTPTKTAKSKRTVYLSPALIDQLAKLKDRQEAERDGLEGVILHIGDREVPAYTETGFVFTTETGQPVDPRNVFRTLQWAAKKANLDGVGIHTLRHSWASLTANSGQPLADVQELLGHSDIRITRRYIHTDEGVRRGVGTHAAGLIGL